jgi:hypothetical protein
MRSQGSPRRWASTASQHCNLQLGSGPLSPTRVTPLPAWAEFLQRASALIILECIGSRIIGFLLAGNMFVAYWTADREALTSIFPDPGKFYAADPYTFLFASLMILILDPGYFAMDTLIAKRFKEAA